MWGTNKRIDIGAFGPASPINGSEQIVKVGYGRPDTWSFLLQGQLVDLTTTGAGGLTIELFFVVLIGLGRTNFRIPAFEHYTWVNGEQDKLIYSTEVLGPTRSAADTVENLIRDIPAETIDVGVSYTATVTGSMSILSAALNVGAFFAPKVHVRPEWHEGRFPGGETEGH